MPDSEGGTIEINKFIYYSARREITFRNVASISESDGYIQALDLDKGELRTFRLDRILEQIEHGTNDADIEARLGYWRANKPTFAPISPSRKQKRPGGALKVCFTGFKAADKESLSAIAEIKGMSIRAGVSLDLDILVGGYNAGPAKLDRARHQGVMILDETQFRHLLETGEISTE